MFHLHDVLREVEHPVYHLVTSDMEGISEDSILQYFTYNEKRLNHLFNDDPHGAERIIREYFFIDGIQNQILRDRINFLQKNKSTDFSETLKSVITDEHDLLPLNLFDGNPYILRDESYFYEICQLAPSSNSHYWLTQVILETTSTLNLNYKVRLDPFVKVPLEEYNPMGYRMIVYGRPLDWEKLRGLVSIDDGEWMSDDPKSSIGRTQYCWKPSDGELHLTIEELPGESNLQVRGSRYFHAIIDQGNGRVKHCDGALRIYTDAEYKTRLKHHIKSTEVTKIGKRYKIFQLDDEVDQKVLVDLITTFYIWNEDVQKYFGRS